MSQFSQRTEVITVPSGGLALRVWDNPYHTPYKNYNIFVAGSVPDVTKLTFEIFIGGRCSNSTPLVVKAWGEDAVTHAGGVSQAGAAGVGASGTEFAAAIYTHAGLLPANALTLPNPMSFIGVPIVIEFKNTNPANAIVQVTYYAETLGTLV